MVGGGEGGMRWEIAADIYTLVCAKQVSDKILLDSTGSSTPCSMVTCMGRQSKKRSCIHIYKELIHFVVQQELTQRCKATGLQ